MLFLLQMSNRIWFVLYSSRPGNRAKWSKKVDEYKTEDRRVEGKKSHIRYTFYIHYLYSRSGERKNVYTQVTFYSHCFHK